MEVKAYDYTALFSRLFDTICKHGTQHAETYGRAGI